MLFPKDQATYILTEVRRIIDHDEPPTERLSRLWNTLVFIEASSVAAAIRNTIGTHVYSGPFKGMQLTPAVLMRAYAPILLGIYEQELHEVIEAMTAKPFRTILNIGCGFGYYSVGLAQRMPQTAVFGFDISEAEQKRTRDLAALNNVQDRVTVSGVFKGTDFSKYADQKTLIIMDIEGGEETLLDPVQYPALQQMDIVVELHDVYGKALSTIIPQRFVATHDIEIIRNKTSWFDLATLVAPGTYIDPYHNMVTTWENRGGPTPWAVMRVKSSKNI